MSRARTHIWPDRPGFTLIELLVVISIIALLIGLLLPSLGAAKDAAINAQCLSNQKAMGLGWHSYVSAYNEVPGMNGSDAWVNGTYWGTPGRQDGGPSAWAPMQGSYIAYMGYPATTNPSWYSRIGYVYPYLSGNSNLSVAHNDGTGKIFYCPGQPGSFGPTDGWPGRPAPAYSTWNGTAGTWDGGMSMSGMDRFGWGAEGSPEGNQQSGTFVTYFFRGNTFEKNVYLDDSDTAGWGTGWTACPNYTLPGGPPSPDSPYLQGKPFLACMWVAYSPPGPNKPAEIARRASLNIGAPHKGKSANLAWTDGAASTWTLPEGVIAPLDIYDRAWNASQYTNVGRPNTPWFFVMALRGAGR